MRFTLFIFLFLCSFAKAQEQFGAVFSNYTPTTSVHYNPSSMLDAKVWLDINIVSAGAYANNNLAYLKDNSYWNLYRTDGAGVTDDDIGFNQNRKKYGAYSRAFASVLSGVWSQGDHAAGLSFNVWSYTAARNVPDYMAKFIEHGFTSYDIQHNIDYSMKNVNVSSVNYGEIKASYAYTFLKKRRDMFMGGISVKKFLSIGGAAVNGYNFDFDVRSDTMMQVYDLNVDAMATLEPELYVKGGMGLDLGFTYQKMLSECSSYLPNTKRNGCRYIPYKYKLAASIIDIGSIKFNPDTRSFAGYSFSNYDWYYYTREPDEDSVLNIFQYQEGDIDNGRVKKTDRIHLPTSLILKADYNLWASRVYANAMLVQGIPVSKEKFGMRKANSLMVGLRYESKFFDIGLPLSLYEYTRPQLGLSVRIAFLTVGTDKLLNIVNKHGDIYGGDIYFHLKIPFYYHPKCKDKIKSGHGAYDPSRIKKKKTCEAYL